MNHISKFKFLDLAFLSWLTLRCVSGHCEQTETNIKAVRKRLILKILWRKIIQQSIFFINGWMCFVIDEFDIQLSNGACGEFAKVKSKT